MRMGRGRAWAALWVLFLGIAAVRAAEPAPAAPADGKVLFNRDIRPLLSDTCFKCHGFDANKRKADLRLDTPEGASADLGGGYGAIVPGKPDLSEAFRRLTSDDPEDKMPPPESGLTLTVQQVELFKRWIAQGAQYQKHWSLIAPTDVTPPTITSPPTTQPTAAPWARNGIDRFILAKLERENLKPSPEADRVTLIRRATLDLTGLPPTPAEVDAFVADTSSDAYESLIDRLLASPRYGERMAMRWLDLARCADTNGYQIDTERAQWPWRDWVIDAFNRNKKFDEFTVEQIAGDLIPNATLDQKIASGFNRNHRITLEGGSIPEEFRVEYVTDRVETTATTWLGLTMGCARCHDHKYDPITQKEFYKFFAFFNNVPENGLDGQFYNSTPFIPAPRGEVRTQLADHDVKVNAAETALSAMQSAIADGQAKWEQSVVNEPPTRTLRDGLVLHYPLDGDAFDKVSPCRGGDFRDGEAKFSPGLLKESVEFDGKKFIDLGDVGRFERTDPFTLAAWVLPTDATNAAFIARMDEKNKERGYNLYWQNGLVHFQMMNQVPDNMITLVSAAPLPANRWHHVVGTYDGSGKAAGMKVYVDGKPLAMNVSVDKLSGSIVANRVPLQIGGRTPGVTRFTGKIDDVRIYNRALSADEVFALGGPKVIVRNVPEKSRTPDQQAAVRQLYVESAAPQEQKDALAKVDSTRAERKKLLDVTPTVMVMQEMPTPRETFVLKRGAYDQPGEKVTPGVPACLPPLPSDAPPSRLTLAKWLVDPKNPLTARVTVNRFWEMYFGTGLVKTTEDLGSQSEWPSHPELLDWLANEFVRSGWDVKAMQKLIVTSATYRQSSRVTPELLEKDPPNKWLARGPRLRLSAEGIRDQALLASGLLVEKLGGPSVKGYQPPKIWEEVTSGGGYTGQTYEQQHGEALYRRSMYTFWKRTVPHPVLTTFDAPSREICTVKRSRTNTPLQALALMNDTIFVESARKLAERAINEGGTRPAERVAYAFRLAVARKPVDAELKILVDGFNHHLATYFNDPDAATKLLGVGESQRNPNLDPRELAAYTAVSSVILNLDQTITRE
jgi:hypothetical protein